MLLDELGALTAGKIDTWGSWIDVEAYALCGNCKDSDKSKAKKERAVQRSAFRDIFRTVEVSHPCSRKRRRSLSQILL